MCNNLSLLSDNYAFGADKFLLICMKHSCLPQP